MEQKFFPIKTATACQLKWSWSTIRLYDGTSRSCHRVAGDPLSIDNFNTFHNSPKKINDRKLMLDGQWPDGGCEYCQTIEDAGGVSDRLSHLQIPNQSPIELEFDPAAVYVTPTIIEVFFDNTCNMSCLYCWDALSSKIHQENKKFGRFEEVGVVIDNAAERHTNFAQLTDAFWSWLTANHKTLKRFHVMGGEPFYQSQFDECLEFFKNNPSPDLELNIVSNLKISESKLQKYIVLIEKLISDNKIKRFDLTASIDCFGPEQEYVRYGINIEQWKINFEKLAAHQWITLNINQTLSSLTIKTVPELIRYINSIKKTREVGHYFGLAAGTHEFLSPDIFGPDFFSKDFDLIINEMQSDTWQERQSRDYMNGIKLKVNASTRQQDKIQQLAVFLNEIDRRRGLNWKTTFQWLNKEVNNVVQ